MHVKEAKIHGERELRLYHVSIWRESPLFSARERAALAWTEVLTQLPPHGVPDEIYNQVRAQFSEKELTDLTFLVMGINAWNRVNVRLPNRARLGRQSLRPGQSEPHLAAARRRPAGKRSDGGRYLVLRTIFIHDTLRANHR